MFDGQLDCRKMREADWNGTPDGISTRQSSIGGTLMTDSNANTASKKSKQCRKCDRVLKADCFNKSSTDSTGLHSYCRECQSAYRKAQYAKTRDHALAYSKAYAKENASLVRERNRKYRKNNPEKIAHWSRVFRESNKEKIKGWDRRYRENNRDKINKRQRARYSSDPIFKMTMNFRTCFNMALKRQAKPKKKVRKTSGLFSWKHMEDVHKHLSALLSEGMTWDNYGTYWHVDHWMPLTCQDVNLNSFSHVRAIWDKSNLRPMIGSENICKRNVVLPEAKANFLRLVKKYESESAQKK